MRSYVRVAAVAALAAIPGAAFAAPASAETAHWATAAEASSEYSSSLPGTGAEPKCIGTGGFDPVPAVTTCRPNVGVNGVEGGAWSAVQATGAPNTFPSCGDIGTAWAPQPSGSDPESITLFYEPVENATRVDIYETNIGGFVTQVDVLRIDGSRETVFTGPDATTCPGILSVPVSGTVVGVDIDTQAPGWEEIDAVGVIN